MPLCQPWPQGLLSRRSPRPLSRLRQAWRWGEHFYQSKDSRRNEIKLHGEGRQTKTRHERGGMSLWSQMGCFLGFKAEGVWKSLSYERGLRWLKGGFLWGRPLSFQQQCRHSISYPSPASYTRLFPQDSCPWQLTPGVTSWTHTLFSFVTLALPKTAK